MVLIRLDLCYKVNYNLKEERFIRWNKIINAKSFEEMASIGKGDEIMEESIEYLKRYCNSDLNHGIKDIILEKELEATEKTEKETLLKTAKRMLKKGIKITLIKEITGLSKTEINKLKSEV